MNNIINEEKEDVKKIFQKIKKRDLNGNIGQAIKNSGYQIATTFVAKVGSLIFTVILARLFVPEVFGLYGLALSTLMLFSTFSDMGISTALLRYLSKKFEEENYVLAKSYYNILLRYKLFLLLLPTFLLIVLSKFISETYYQKPIFFALLAGILYVPANGLGVFLNQIFFSRNNFRVGFVKEIIFQVARLILVPLVIILSINKISTPITLMNVFLTLSVVYIITLIYIYFKIPYKNFKEVAGRKLTPQEKKDLGVFILPLSVTALSGMFFGSIDTIMLGHFVLAEFVGYYQSAFGLISAASAIVAFSGTALFPIFSRLKGKRLESGLRKSVITTSWILIPACVLTYFLASPLITIIYGQAYSPAINILKLFSLILISAPLSGIYASYYQSQGHTLRYASIIVSSTIINILLNYLLITSLLPSGMLNAVMGAGVATIISGYIHLGMLIIFRKK